MLEAPIYDAGGTLLAVGDHLGRHPRMDFEIDQSSSFGFVASSGFSLIFKSKIHSKSISKRHARWNASFGLHSKGQDALG